ncbi:hypothetical protein ACFSJS_06460 [Streptomyces desertarenae]|uniref:DUF7737 domain-containing protein n=1 Tax=Streptomyces desertarenae TaxID=2666184 RepID=A0ABW4PF26_9ACTN
MTAAGRQGITAGQLIERSVSGHGPASDGSLEHGLGEHRARVAIEDATDGAAHLPFAGPKEDVAPYGPSCGAGRVYGTRRHPPCTVPSHRRGDGTVFLPFEDDRLSLILSKALLPAADTTVTDEPILHQIKRGT